VIDKVVIPAAGDGKRMKKISDNAPKELLPIVNNRVVIDYIMEEITVWGVKKLGVVINPRKEILKEYLNKNYTNFEYKYFIQTEPRGLGDAITLVSEWIDDVFGVVLPDDVIVSEKPPMSKLKEVYDEFGSTVIGVSRSDHMRRYGVVVGEEIKDGIFLVKDLIEKPSEKILNGLVIVGRYFLTDSIFGSIGGRNPRTGEIELTDGLKKLMRTEDIYAVIINGFRFDCGNVEGFFEFLKYAREGVVG